jgi:geranylgeranyl reductase family protein
VDFDVAVAGGGPAGSTAAHLLARAGARVVLVDRAEFPRDKPCGGGVTGRARVEAPCDLTPVIEQEVSTVRFSFRLGSFFDYRYPTTLVYMTQRRRLDAYLLEKARAAGVEVREGSAVRGVLEGNGTARLLTDDGEVMAKTIVGADGANGTVARSLALNPAPDPPVALEANFFYRGDDGDCLPPGWRGVLGLELGSVNGGYGWSFPKADHFNVGCGGFRTEGVRLRPHLAALARHYGLRPDLAVNIRGHHLPTRLSGRPIAREKTLLVGDAAGLVDPMSGEGIYAAFVSGRLAAESILASHDSRGSLAARYEASVEQVLMPDIRAATLLRDAYHYLPGLCYVAMRHSGFLRRSLCRLMLGEITYASFVQGAGPLRPAIGLVAALGRQSRGRRARVTVPPIP